MPETLRRAWTDQRRWSTEANREKRWYTVGRILMLALPLTAAFLETTAASLHRAANDAENPVALVSLLGIGGALLLGATPFVQRYLAGRRQLTRWLRMRSASESVKSEVYRCVSGTGAYRTERPHEVLRREMSSLEAATRDLAPAMERIVCDDPPLPDVRMAEDYLEKRLRGQFDGYYKDAARHAGTLARWMRRGQAALAIAAGLLGVLATWKDPSRFAPWIAVLTTAVSAVAAHLAAGRYEFLELTYTATMRELRDLHATFTDTWMSGNRETAEFERAYDKLVDAAERAISKENQAWMTKWTQTSKRRPSLGDSDATGP